MIQRYDWDGPITNENAWRESSTQRQRPKPQTVPPTAAYAFIRKNSELQPSRNAMKR